MHHSLGNWHIFHSFQFYWPCGSDGRQCWCAYSIGTYHCRDSFRAASIYLNLDLSCVAIWNAVKMRPEYASAYDDDWYQCYLIVCVWWPTLWLLALSPIQFQAVRPPFHAAYTLQHCAGLDAYTVSYWVLFEYYFVTLNAYCPVVVVVAVAIVACYYYYCYCSSSKCLYTLARAVDSDPLAHGIVPILFHRTTIPCSIHVDAIANSPI